MKKIVDDAHYHIWSDALHLRQLARQTPDRWDRATYVRGAIVMAWTAFETTLSEALAARRLGGRFRENLDEAVSRAGLAPLDWSKGVWQRISALNALRVDYVHRTAGSADLLPEVNTVDNALQAIREAVSDLYGQLGNAAPHWIADDTDRGWVGKGVVTDFAYGYSIHSGVDPDAPDTIRVAYRDNRGEHIHAYHPADADPAVLARRLFETLRQPVSYIRIYRGSSLELEWAPRMRGAP